MTRRKPATDSHPFCYEYPHPAVTTDIAVFTIRDDALHVLLIKRGQEPFLGDWALPGGFLQVETETLDESAARELHEETGLNDPVLEQYAIFDAPGRDPRERVITVAYGALVPSTTVSLRAATDAAAADWFSLAALPSLAFDHAEIIGTVRARVAKQVKEDLTLLFAFLADPEHFTLRELHLIYEAVTGKRFDRANFRRKVRQDRLPIVPLGESEGSAAHESGVRHRPAEYYRVAKGAG